MKIGIITLPLQYNYGGILQAYALQIVLERMGHEVRIIRKSQIKEMPKKAFLRYTKRLLMKILNGGKGEVFIEKDHNKKFPKLTSNTWRFVNKYIHSDLIRNYTELKEGIYDGYIVGSDQVWRSGYTESILPFFLNFAEGWNVKRVAYAASFGLDQWPIAQSETGESIRLAQLFDAVSVREDSGVLLCREYLKIEAKQVLDPTLLLDKEDYINLIVNYYNEKCLTTYTLDENPEKLKIIEAIKNEKKLSQNKLFTKEHNSVQPLASIEEWLNSFQKSEFVFTDSFHGTVFSIIFNKQFVVFANEHRGTSRMNSLLSLFGLQNRLVHSYDEYLSIKDIQIEYAAVNEMLNKLREESLCFLKDSLI